MQNDIKRVIAYSTCSQLGYMFVAAGIGVYSVAMFHLLTHAFFKAMLFLGAGSVIHGMHHEQDMRNYGGLRHKMPKTFWAMMIGTLAITGVGIPFLYVGFPVGFAGFVSKDAIIESAYAANAPYAFWMLVIAAFMTSFYSWRLMFMTFYGKPRGNKKTHEHAQESPNIMLVPLLVLAFGAVFSGMVFYKPYFGSDASVGKFFGVLEASNVDKVEDHSSSFMLISPAYAASDKADDHSKDTNYGKVDWPLEPGRGAIFKAADNHVLHDAHSVPAWVKLSPFFAMISGLALAFLMYIWRPDFPRKLANQHEPIYKFLLNKWYFDELYNAIIIKPVMWLGQSLWKQGDTKVIDGGINGVAMGVVPFFTKWVNRAQSGYIFTYAFAMVLGITAMLTWVSMTGGSN